MRAFLAFEVSEEVRGRLLSAQGELRKTGADLALVGLDNLHFTVKFLGDVPDDITHEIDRRLESLEMRQLQVGVRGVGAFPDLRRPRVVWAGVAEQDREGFNSLAGAVLAALEGVGREDEREFHAHVTLGRVRSPRNVGALQAFIRTNEGLDFGATPIESLKLKSSVLTPRGAVYSDVREYALR